MFTLAGPMPGGQDHHWGKVWKHRPVVEGTEGEGAERDDLAELRRRSPIAATLAAAAQRRAGRSPTSSK